MKEADFLLSDHGSIWLVEPVTADAWDWVDHELTDVLWHGAQFAVEPRYLRDVVLLIHEAGMSVSGNTD